MLSLKTHPLSPPQDVGHYTPYLTSLTSSAISQPSSYTSSLTSDFAVDSSEKLGAKKIKLAQEIIVATTKIKAKPGGVGDGCIGIDLDRTKWLVKYMNINIINNIANCINEFVSYPIFETFLRDSEIILPFMALQKTTEVGVPGVAIKFLDSFKDLKAKRQFVKPKGIENLLAVRACIGDDDWYSANVLMSTTPSKQLATCDHGKSFMAMPNTAENFLNYFEHLFKRWYYSYKLDYAALLEEFTRIHALYLENAELIIQRVKDRVDLLQNELGNELIQKAVFSTRANEGYTLSDLSFTSFEQYYQFCKESFNSKMLLIPGVITILEERVREQETSLISNTSPIKVPRPRLFSDSFSPHKSSVKEGSISLFSQLPSSPSNPYIPPFTADDLPIPHKTTIENKKKRPFSERNSITSKDALTTVDFL